MNLLLGTQFQVSTSHAHALATGRYEIAMVRGTKTVVSLACIWVHGRRWADESEGAMTWECACGAWSSNLHSRVCEYLTRSPSAAKV